MGKNNHFIYISTLLLSVLLYGIPFEIGGNTLRLILGLLTLFLFIYLLWRVWRLLADAGPARSSIVLWLFNSLAIFHLVLIYMSISLPDATWLIGLILGVVIYYLVRSRIQQLI